MSRSCEKLKIVFKCRCDTFTFMRHDTYVGELDGRCPFVDEESAHFYERFTRVRSRRQLDVERSGERHMRTMLR
jgi:hypothetical protein